MIRQLYYHGDDIKVSICVKNNSQKIVKKIVVNVVQCIDVAMFTGGHHTSRIFRVETSEVSFYPYYDISKIDNRKYHNINK